MFIQEIKAREILDSRGNPTIETKVALSDGSIGIASVPSGASTGSLEAIELRDKDYARYDGFGVLRAVENVNNVIANHLYKKDPTNQIEIDKLLNAIDGTRNKSHMGANALLSVSIAVAKAASQARKLELFQYLHSIYELVNKAMYKHENNALEAPDVNKITMPTPIFNIINGGKHADDDLTFQEFTVIPQGSQNISDKIRIGSEIWHQLKKLLNENGYESEIGDEGGFAPNLSGLTFAPNVSPDERAFELIREAIKRCGCIKENDVALGIDMAAGTFYSENKIYSIPEEKRQLTSGEMIKHVAELIDKYNLVIVEDPLAETDHDGWTNITKDLAEKTILVGDDLFATDLFRLEEGVVKKQANGIIIKPNQIGTLTEALETVVFAQRNKYTVIVSHRSGETNDTFIADLAVAVGANFIKAGSPVRGERVAKYNRLMEIEKLL